MTAPLLLLIAISLVVAYFLPGVALAASAYLIAFATPRLILFVAERPARLPRAEVVRC